MGLGAWGLGGLSAILKGILGSDSVGAELPLPARKPNVLCIVIDDLRPDLGCYGVPEMVTPNLDRLAATGVLFERAYSQYALCGPSRESFFTGCRPDTTGFFFNTTGTRGVNGPPLDVASFPLHFKNHGYLTRGFGKTHDHTESWWSEPLWSAPYEYRYAKKENRARYKRLHAQGVRGTGKLGPIIERADAPDNAYRDGMVVDEIVETLHERDDRPFFFVVGLEKPHRPYAVPKRYWKMYPTRDVEIAPIDFPHDVPKIALKDDGDDEDDVPEPEPRTEKREDELRQLNRGYYACVSYVDAQVGRLLDGLESAGCADNTIVVLFSDHGFHLGENGLRAKNTAFERALHVPLIVRAPGLHPPGQRVSALTELVDVYPFLCDVCGIPRPEHLEGASFKPLMANPNRPWKKMAVSQCARERGDVMGYSIRTERYRFVRWQWKDGDRVEYELYDHQVDPGEMVNIADDPAQVETLRKLDALLDAGWQAARPPGG